MTVVNGLPAHALLVHFIVILAPLTALLVMLCALVGFLPAARAVNYTPVPPFRAPPVPRRPPRRVAC